MNRQYCRVIKEFDCYGKHMITVQIGNAVHVMDYSDWQLIYGRNHQGKWKKKVDWNKFVPREKYKQSKVS